MEQYQAIIEILALSMGVAWASGINLYAVLLVLGLGGSGGYIDLPAELTVLQDPVIIAAAGLMYLVEFGADKVPGVDSVWDSLHTFIRLPAGAMLAASTVGEVEPALVIAAAIVGGGVSATSHFMKSGSRLLINTSPEPVTNWSASIGEDIAVLSGLWLALNHPIIFLIALALFLAFAIWAIPKLWKLIKEIFMRIRCWMKGETYSKPEVEELPVELDLTQLPKQ
jgi:hypothetical protein